MEYGKADLASFEAFGNLIVIHLEAFGTPTIIGFNFSYIILFRFLSYIQKFGVYCPNKI